MFFTPSAIEQRIRKLQTHLAQENPVLLEVVKSFRNLDRIAYGLGILSREESFATRVPWWPMVSVLGTFSSGKSTFINHYLGQRVQLTGNQAVDDKFTVICYANDDNNRVLPGIALDADPRFPFYKVSADIESVAEGEGDRVDAYLQLKTCHSDVLRGKIFIDSPGFDADDQRTSTLRIIDHIIDLSDLVLVFFDARHPEPGAMRDTLEHLVRNTVRRNDSNKFMFILNQIDNAAREDNPEEVVGAWQRALAQSGLTAGRFFTIYNPEAAIPIEDPKLRQRFQARRDADVEAIRQRLERVDVERAYRVIAVLERSARQIETQVAPALARARRRWRRRVLWFDGIVVGLLAIGALTWSIRADYWRGLDFAPPWLATLIDNPWLGAAIALLVVAGFAYLHFVLRRVAARGIVAELRREPTLEDVREWVVRGFEYATKPWRPMWSDALPGWTRGARRRIARVLSDSNRFVQALNNRFTDPSGRKTLIRRNHRPSGEATDAANGGTEDLQPPPRAAEAVSEMQVAEER